MEFKPNKEKIEELYNAEQKLWFIDEYSTSAGVKTLVFALFRAVAEQEKALGKDICTMNEVEIDKALSNTSSVGAKTRANRLSILRAYFRWCQKRNIPTTTVDFSKFRDAGIDVVRERYVSGPVHLKAYLDAVFDSPSETNTHCIYRAFLWLAFSGIRKDETSQLCCQDIDLVNLRINFEGKQYPIYPESLPELRTLKELDYLLYSNSAYKDETPMKRKRVDGDHLLRGIRADANDYQISVAVTKFILQAYKSGAVKNKLSYSGIRYSGKFFRERSVELALGSTNFIRMAEEEAECDREEFSSKEEYDRYVKRKAKSLRHDYESWRFAFEV